MNVFLRRSVLPMLMSMFMAGAALPADGEAARKELTIEDQYKLGLRYMKRGYYIKALEQFNRIRNYHRDDPYAVKAELAIGDVYYEKHEWDQARMAYEDFARMHPRYDDLDYVVYKIGMAIYQKAPTVAGRDQTWTRQAVNTWSGFESRFAESTYREEVSGKLDECRERLAKKEVGIAWFYYRRDAPRAVEGRVSGLLRDYPDSEHAGRALALMGWARAAQGDAEAAAEILKRLETEDQRWARWLNLQLQRRQAR